MLHHQSYPRQICIRHTMTLHSHGWLRLRVALMLALDNGKLETWLLAAAAMAHSAQAELQLRGQ